MASFHQVFTTAYFPTVLMRTKDPKGDAALPQISLMVNRNLMPAIRLAGWLAVIASQVPGKTLKRPASIVGRKREFPGGVSLTKTQCSQTTGPVPGMECVSLSVQCCFIISTEIQLVCMSWCYNFNRDPACL